MSDFNIENGRLIEYLGTDTNVVVPNGVAEIGGSCFADSTIRSIIFPNTLKTIGFRAFINCKMLTDVTIPDSVTTISDKAFMNCEGLEKIKLSKNIKSIPWKCFFGCSSLESIVIPEGVTTIGIDAFCACQKMRYCVFPDSLTYVGDTAFIKMGSYSDKVGIYIVNKYGYPRNISFGNAPFQNNKPVFVTSVDKVPKAAGGITLNINMTKKKIDIDYLETLTGYDEYDDEYDEWKESIETIDFSKAKNVEIIDERTFSYFSNLKYVLNLPQNLIKIGEEAFRESLIKEINIPNGVQEIDDYAFIHCIKLNLVYIPHSLKKIGKCVFGGCVSLAKIIYDGTKSEWEQIEKDNGNYDGWYFTDFDKPRPSFVISCNDGNINI